MAYADEKLFLWINGLAGEFHPLDQVMEWLVSDYLVPAGLALVLVGLWFYGSDLSARQRYQMCVCISLISLSLSSLSVFIVNAIFFRPRPFVGHEVNLLFYQPTDSSFPANSIAVTFAVAASVWGVNRLAGTVLLIATSLYGFSRIYSGVHYPADVVSGALIAFVVTYLLFRVKHTLSLVLIKVIKAGRIFCLA